VFMYQNVKCKTYNKTSIQEKNSLQTYTLVVNKFTRTPFEEVLRTAHIKLFPVSSSSAQKPSSIFTTASISKMDFSHPQITAFTYNGLPHTWKYFNFSAIDFYVGLKCICLIFHHFDHESPNVAFCCGKTCAFRNIIFSVL